MFKQSFLLLATLVASAAMLACEGGVPTATAGAGSTDVTTDLAAQNDTATTPAGGSADGASTGSDALPTKADASPAVDDAANADAAPVTDVAPIASPDTQPGGDAAPVDAKLAPPPAFVPPEMAVSGTQYNGSVAYLRKAPAGLAWVEEFVEISAPITPKTQVIYPKQGDKFPKDLAGMQALAHEAALTYDYLLTACAKDYPGITILPPEAPKVLPADKLSKNFELTAKCSYDKWTAKPYWIPMLVDKVDICATELGADWALLGEADLAGLTADQAAVLKKGLTPSDNSFFGNFYFSTHVFVRSVKGLLMTGALEVGAALKTVEDSMPCKLCFPDAWTYHLEGGTTLRCIRVRGVKVQ